MRISGYSWRAIESFFPFKKNVNAVIDNQTGVALNSFTAGVAHGQATSAFGLPVVLPDNRIFFPPLASTRWGVLSADRATLTTGLHGAGGGTSKYGSGVLAPNGKVILIPQQADRVAEFDPATNTFTPTATHGESATIAAFLGGCVISDEFILFVAGNSSLYFGLYNYRTKTYVRGPAKPSSPVNPTYFGCVPTGTGKVFVTFLNSSPEANGKHLLLDIEKLINGAKSGSYASGTVTEIPGDIASNQENGAVLLPNGKICTGPRQTTSVRVYDPVSNTYATYSGLTSSASRYGNPVLLPNGNVFFTPRNTTKAALFNYKTGVISETVATVGSGANDFLYSSLDLSGKIVMSPFTNANIHQFEPLTGGKTFDSQFTLSRFMNGL